MKILLATDGTYHNEFAAEVFGRIRLADGDTIKIVSVVDMALPFAVDVYTTQPPTALELEQRFKNNAVAILTQTEESIRAACSNTNILLSSELLIGSPERRIVETAEEMAADLIVVGSHGYNRWERLLLGSVSDSVVHHAPCSVLIVRMTKKL